MQRLFDVIPDRFFSILASGKKELYLEAVLILREASKKSIVIRRSDFLELLSDRLGSVISADDFSDEEKEYGENAGISGKVSMIMRRLTDCGWIQTEYASSSSFEENIIIPDYAVRIIDALTAVMEDKETEYNGYVFSTYAVLRQAEDDKDFRYTALNQAYDNTEAFIESLKVLYNNIRRYMQRVSKLGVNQLLADHFDKYAEDVIRRILDPIKRTDSIYRFKQPILSILDRWLDDESIIESLASSEAEKMQSSDIDKARDIVREMISYISSTYGDIPRTIEMIEQRHAEYTKAAIDRMSYMVNYDRGIRGQIARILSLSSRPEVMKEMIGSIGAVSSSILSPSSVYERIERTAKEDSEVSRISQRTLPSDIADELEREFDSIYSPQRIDDFILAHMDSSGSVNTAMLPIDGEDESILFILAILRSTELSSPFTMEDTGHETVSGGFILPDMIFRRRHA